MWLLRPPLEQGSNHRIVSFLFAVSVSSVCFEFRRTCLKRPVSKNILVGINDSVSTEILKNVSVGCRFLRVFFVCLLWKRAVSCIEKGLESDAPELIQYTRAKKEKQETKGYHISSYPADACILCGSCGNEEHDTTEDQNWDWLDSVRWRIFLLAESIL